MGRQAQGQRDKQSHTGNEKKGERTWTQIDKEGRLRRQKRNYLGGTDNHSQKNKGRKYEAGQGKG